MSQKMSLTEDKTGELWGRFMPKRMQVQNSIGEDLYSMQVYDELVDYDTYDPSTVFEKRALIEVENSENPPEGMEAYTLQGGKYAVFDHKGPIDTFQVTLDYIFKTWLPSSGFEIDHREHFEILGEKYLGPFDPNTEEEVWIPIK